MHNFDHLLSFLQFLCKKYSVDRSLVFIEYSSDQPPSIVGGRAGYYDGLLSYRERSGNPEFLITIFRAARDPFLTLAHEFAHLVRNQKSGMVNRQLSPPDDELESALDVQAREDVSEFRSSRMTIDSAAEQVKFRP